MQPVLTFTVSPKLPKVLEPLNELAQNLWWTWEPDARKLFRDLDVALWDKTNHNPIRMLQLSRQARLIELAEDEDYLRSMRTIFDRFQRYMHRADTYGKQRAGTPRIAYFSAEFGFHESVPNYSGGLGILSGDHCKSASDLDLPFSAVTLLYRHGYFKQEINRDGWQEAVSLNQNFHHLPVREAAIVGRPSEEWGEAVVAYVVWDGPPDEQALLDFAAQRLAAYKRPRQIHIVSELDILDTPRWYSKLARKEYTIGLNVTGVSVDDPDGNIVENYSCNSERNYTQYCNAEVRCQNMPGIQVWAVNLQHASPNQPREQPGRRSCHAGREDGASAQHHPEGNCCQGSNLSARPDTTPGVSPEILLMLKLEQNYDCDD